MEREDIIGYIMIIFVVVFCLKMYYESDAFNLKYTPASDLLKN